MSNDYDDELPPDNMAGMANAMIIITGIMLIGAIFIMWQLQADQYGGGPLGG